MSDAPFPPQFYNDWVNFFANDKEPCRLNCYHKLFEIDLCPLQRKKELAEVIDVIFKNAGQHLQPVTAVMEIGTDKCGTFYHWLKAFPGITTAIACEIRGTPFSDLFEKAFPKVKFLWLSESSLTLECQRKVSDFLGDTQLDFLFIDGDKEYFGEDFDKYVQFLKPHGIALFHDVFDNDQPMQEAFLKRAKKYNKTKVIIDTSECDERKTEILEGTAIHNGYTQWLDIWSHTSCGFGCIWAGSKM